MPSRRLLIAATAVGAAVAMGTRAFATSPSAAAVRREVLAWSTPTVRAIRAASDRLNLGITRQEAQLYAELAPGLVAAHGRVRAAWEKAHPMPEPPPYARGTDALNAVEFELGTTPGTVGSLAGKRVAIKSTIAYGGVPLAAGSRLVQGHVPRESATVVLRTLAAGAAVTHTTRTDDLCLAITGATPWDGPVLNPWDRDRTTGGSSAGAAALLAAGLVDLAIMVDQAGSGRVPPSHCGAFALLPTSGLIPMTGILGFTPVQDRVAVAGRRVREVAVLASELSGTDRRDRFAQHAPRDWTRGLRDGVRGLRVGIVGQSLTPEFCTPEVAAVVRARADDLALAGAVLSTVDIPQYGEARDLAMLLTVHGGVPAVLAGHFGHSPGVAHGDPELVHQVSDRRDRDPGHLGATTKLSAAVGAACGDSAEWVAATLDGIARLTTAWDAALNGVDVLLTPTVYTPALPAPGPGTPDGEVIADAIGKGIAHTCGLNLTAHPAAQIPGGTVDGLPVGVQAIAGLHREDRLLRVATVLEPSGGWPTAPQGAER
ncbi:amidase family protein [Streptomyces antioxidans]|nr:amidase family protein [Streptomyces antioxidans]